MASPTFLIGPALGVGRWARQLHQRRRKVKLTVHRAVHVGPMASFGATATIAFPDEHFFITVTNASHEREIVVTHVWLDTEPPIHVHDTALPVRLKHSAPWETSVPVAGVPGDLERVPWLARCLLSPDDKIVKSRPRKYVPPFGTVPRG
jgi:hypothetical protein